MPPLSESRTTRFNICRVRTARSVANFDGLIAQLAGALADLGYDCTLSLNEAVAGSVNILVGSVAFAWPHRGQLMPSVFGHRFVLYQAEQLDAAHPLFRQHAPVFAEIFGEAAAIWEYSPRNMQYFRTSPWVDRVHHLPPAFHRALESFTPDQDRPTDVLFFGSLGSRRRQILDQLSARGARVVYLHGAYALDLEAEIRQSKIVLNMHSVDTDMLETLRVSHLLANRCFVVSEVSDHNPYGDGVVFAPYDQLVETCIAYLGPRAAEREKVAAAGYAAVRRCDMVANLREAIARLPIAQLTAT